MWQAIILSVNQCPKQSIVSIVNLANPSLSVIWQALKVAVSYLDSPEGLPAKQAAFLSGLPSSDYLAASANTNAPELPPWPSPVTQCSWYTTCYPHWHHCFLQCTNLCYQGFTLDQRCGSHHQSAWVYPGVGLDHHTMCYQRYADFLHRCLAITT